MAKYRQTVLDGFREVENYLVQLKVLEDEAVVSNEALEAARESLRLTENQYKAGLIAYLDVVTVQATALEQRAHRIDPAADTIGGQCAIDCGAGRWLGWAYFLYREGLIECLSVTRIADRHTVIPPQTPPGESHWIDAKKPLVAI